ATRTGSQPSSASAAECSAKSPCRLSTPTRGRRPGSTARTAGPEAVLPATLGKQLALGQRLERDAAHRLRQPAADLLQQVGSVPVGDRLHDGAGHACLVLARGL